ncbi:MAG: peptidylprolyl isomerase [Spirochaetes bacterium]|jgi:foldase protein PrsA|nr:peptidylprolyl isomerase [Spirochaetota bacterium]
MKLIKIALILILTTIPVASAIADASDEWYTVDKVIALVNDDPILYSELSKRVELNKKRKNVSKKDRKNLTFSTLDSFINEKLLHQAANREYILVSEEKVDSKIKELMEYTGSKNLEQFKKAVEKNENIPYEAYREELKNQLIIEQIMVYAMTYTPPTEAEAKAWYNKNKSQLLQLRFQHILITPKGDSFSAEKAANEQISQLREKALSGESFARLARQHSEDKASARADGFIDWISPGQLDQRFAYVVYNMKKRGEISQVFKSSFGYHIVKFYGRRYMPFEEIRNRIFQMISQEARMKQFQEWVKSEREKSHISVYVDGFDKYRASLEKK